jgi:HAD superfamily hydrolase (TIGR01509 family)
MDRTKPVIIFDMDGVLFDSEPLHVKFEDKFLLEMGVSLTVAQKRKFIGLAGDKMWTLLKELKNLNPSVDELVKSDIERRIEFFSENVTTKMPGAEALLIRLSNEGFRMALASSSQTPLIDLQLSRAGFERFFEQKVSGYMVKNGKPDPDIFLFSANLMKTSPKNCIVIEDSCNGVLAAKAAGMKCIGFSSNHFIEQDLSGADIMVNDLKSVSMEMIYSLFKSYP